MELKLSIIGLLFSVQLQLVFTCLPDYVPDAYMPEVRDEEINADFIPKSVNKEALAQGRSYHPTCGCGVQSQPLTLDDLRLENIAKVNLLPIYPWNVLIEFENSTKKCAGTIINDLFVLTNAQCFLPISDTLSLIDVWIGTKPENLPISKIRIYANVKNPYGTEHKEQQPLLAKNVTIHPNFTLTYFLYRKVDYDFALIQLTERLDLTVYSSVCLLEEGEVADYRSVYSKLYAVGWGDEIDHIYGAPKFYETHDLRDFRNFEKYFVISDNICSIYADVRRMRCFTELKPYIGDGGYGGALMLTLENTLGTALRVFQIGILTSHKHASVDMATEIDAILPFVDYFSKEANATWCSDYRGRKQWLPWSFNNETNKTETLDCKCGKKIKSQTGRIQGGEETSAADFPWTVLLYKIFKERARNAEDDTYIDHPHICTGSLINDQLILTTTACIFHKIPQLEGVAFEGTPILAGETIAYDDDLTNGFKDFDVGDWELEVANAGNNVSHLSSPTHRLRLADAFFFPDYVRERVVANAATYKEANIVLLKLAKKLEFPAKANYNLVCLPKIEDGEQLEKNIQDRGWPLTLTGYGITDYQQKLDDVPTNTDFFLNTSVDTYFRWLPDWVESHEEGILNPGFSPLMQVIEDITIQGVRNCTKWLPKEEVTDGLLLCSVEDSKAFLLGDDGAPLVYKEENGSDYKYTQIGMAAYNVYDIESEKKTVTFPEEGDRVNVFPAFYVSVQRYMPFIEFVSNEIGAEFCKA